MKFFRSFVLVSEGGRDFAMIGGGLRAALYREYQQINLASIFVVAENRPESCDQTVGR